MEDFQDSEIFSQDLKEMRRKMKEEEEDKEHQARIELATFSV